MSDPRAKGGCPRWPETLWLVSSTGEFTPGRCRSTNLCDYCAKLAAVENTELLWLDAQEQGSPGLWAVLTTREPVWDPERFNRALEAVWKAVRRRWPSAHYCGLVEFTTGYGHKSGGRRRPHWNLFIRGVPVEDRDRLHAVMARVWCNRIDALPEYQWVDRVAEDRGGMRGLTRYVGLHFQKESQAPPKGWRGHRFRASSGYFVRPRSVLRVEARASIVAKRQLWKASQLLGDAPAELLELEVASIAEREAASSWSLVHRRAGTNVAGRIHAERQAAGDRAISRDTPSVPPGAAGLSASRPIPSGVRPDPSDTDGGEWGSLAAATTPPPAFGARGDP